MKLKLLLLFFLYSLLCSAQENCNNGIDDDGDGKIDLNDSDCLCSNSTITSIIPNPSFEEYINCPSNYSELNSASPWIQATNATTDYFNKCGLIAPGIKTAGLDNFPDGNGIIGAIFKDNFQEYVGSKLLSPMKAGVQYQLTLNIAALSLNGDFQLTNDKYEPVNLTLFGCEDGDNLPVQTTGGPTSYDPTWIELGYTNYALSPNWGEITIFFTPKTDINAIILGAPNKVPTSYPEQTSALFPYFLYDNLLLNTAASFGINITQTGNFCDNTLVLKASLTTTVNSDKKYQWYHNEIAISGATDDFYNVPSIETNLGQYSVKLTEDNNCLISRKITINNLIPSPDFTVVQPNCTTPTGTINITTPASAYSFDNGLTWQSASSKNSLQVGNYGIKIKTLNGCISFSGGVTILPPKMLENPEQIVTQPSTCGEKGTITIKSSIATQYSFDDGITWTTNPVKNNLDPGNYLIKIKDASECQSSGQYAYIFPKYLENPVFSIIQPSCGKAGQITITTTADQYSFDNGVTWTASPIASNLKDGSFGIKIKNNNGCESNTVYAYIQSYRLPIYPAYTRLQPICGTGGTIEITSEASEFSFDGGKTWTKNPVSTNLLPGTYEILFKNELGCFSNSSYVNLDYFYLPNPSFTFTKPTCETGGTITITTPASEYSFDNGKTWSTNPTATNLKPGTYYIMIKNEIGCTSSTYHYVTLDNFYLPDPTFIAVNPSCGNIGSIEITSKADFYSFNGGLTWTTNPIKSNLSAGSYFLKVKNNLGCASNNVAVYLDANYLATPNYEVIQPTCKTNGVITITTKSDFYSFDNGATWTTNPVLSNFINSYYYIKIKNNKGCESNYVFFYIESAPKISNKPSITSISPSNCGSKNGSITITTPAISYSFDNGITWGTSSKLENLENGTYQVKIMESLSSCPSEATIVTLNPSDNVIAAPAYTTLQPTCTAPTGTITINTPADQYSFDNGVTFTNSNSKSNLAIGSYLIKIKNSSGCISLANTVAITAFTSFKIESSGSVQTLCAGETTTGIEMRIDTPASEYSFDDGLTWSTNPFRNNLKANTEYCLRIKNALGCISERTCTTTIQQIPVPQAPLVTVNHPTDCNSKTGTITITSVKAQYSFDDGVTWSTSPTSQFLAPGSYLVRTKEPNSLCVSFASIVKINFPPDTPAKPLLSVSQPKTCSNPFGSIQITSNASAYSFDNGMKYSTNPNSGLLAVGTYHIKIKNSNCESDAVIVKINVPTDYPVIPTVNMQQPDCSNPKGVITVNTVAAGYSFDNGLTWSPSATSSYLNSGEYFVKIKNTDGCVSEAAKAIIIPFTDFPPTPTIISPQTFCIQQIANLGSISITGQKIKWYDALTNGTLLSNTTPLQNGITSYASQTINGCESGRIPVLINIQNTTAPPASANQTFCSSQNPTLNTIVISGTAIQWYDTTGTLLSNSTPLQDGVTYYASQTENSCESTNKLAVTVSLINTLPANNYEELFCDDLNDGSEKVNLSDYNSKLISNTSGYKFSYYSTFSSAENQLAINQINDFSNYKLVIGDNNIYVRINSNTPCYAIVELKLTLVSKPIITIPNVVPICENNSITVDAGSGFDTYLWSTGATTSSINVNIPGNYSVTVTNNYTTISCSSTKSFEVRKSNIASITSVDTEDWTDNQNTITVYATGAGDFEYSIDGTYFQDSNQFSNIVSGQYTVHVRDKNGCGTITNEVYLLMYPKFFTPNGDGFNDTWKIKFSDIEIGLSVKLFDRYGKLIKELQNNIGWDGTFNNHELPATDYWFVVNRANGKEYKGHFSLKR